MRTLLSGLEVHEHFAHVPLVMEVVEVFHLAGCHAEPPSSPRLVSALATGQLQVFREVIHRIDWVLPAVFASQLLKVITVYDEFRIAPVAQFDLVEFPVFHFIRELKKDAKNVCLRVSAGDGAQLIDENRWIDVGLVMNTHLDTLVAGVFLDHIIHRELEREMVPPVYEHRNRDEDDEQDEPSLSRPSRRISVEDRAQGSIS